MTVSTSRQTHMWKSSTQGCLPCFSAGTVRGCDTTDYITIQGLLGRDSSVSGSMFFCQFRGFSHEEQTGPSTRLNSFGRPSGFFCWPMDFETARSMVLRLFTSRDVVAHELFEELPGFRILFRLVLMMSCVRHRRSEIRGRAWLHA